jgi:dihydroorotase
MSDSRISVRLDEDTQRRLDALVTYFLNQPAAENCLTLARRHGLIGCAKRLPADLSTNRDHFEGFGR